MQTVKIVYWQDAGAMKGTDLIKLIESYGCVPIRHGAKHDWYPNPSTGISQPIPRHREINDLLARHIVKTLNHPSSGKKKAR